MISSRLDKHLLTTSMKARKSPPTNGDEAVASSSSAEISSSLEISAETREATEATTMSSSQPPSPKRFKWSADVTAATTTTASHPFSNPEDDSNEQDRSVEVTKSVSDQTTALCATATTATSSRGSNSSSSSSSNSSQGENDIDNDDNDESGEHSSSSSSSSSSDQTGPHHDHTARGVAIDLDDQHHDLDLENEDDEELDDEMVRRLFAAAAARGIPLEFLAHFQTEEQDANLEYPFGDSPPQSLQDVAQFILSDSCQNIVILAGAGMSVASGIPDFRSTNGLYATLQAHRLTASSEQQERIRIDPSYSLDHHLFLENPLPCLEVNREFVLGMHRRQWKATLAHRFVELLHEKFHDKDKLRRLYTQNIDGLEDQCGLPHFKRIAVHGSMDEAVCASCHVAMDWNEFCHEMQTKIKDITGNDPTAPKESTPIHCRKCGNPTVKPNIVLFRSPLPKEFFQNVPQDTRNADLLLILGTSLGVAPANSLVWRVPRTCMRVLINREPVGGHLGLNFDRSPRDYLARGNCETVVLELMEHLGWLDDLRPFLQDDLLPRASSELLRAKLHQVDSCKVAAAASESSTITSSTQVFAATQDSATTTLTTKE